MTDKIIAVVENYKNGFFTVITEGGRIWYEVSADSWLPQLKYPPGSDPRTEEEKAAHNKLVEEEFT